ncbi:hypothetical protein [Halodesulfovibrio spirochaetisodalis]|uniref:Uncharacterized protein n=1 Tax=Halodesulfovibrio spirochaetisodalis TaxID=1560234 RepID=A0A1B7XCD1_9BACT|nr:hypothetical protein [Halodesulfovibrio spirochaetisodalis]OBQ51574.1 hypothetical protein SP90_09330 [Halodesulfovibrio spirochaetisodalis]
MPRNFKLPSKIRFEYDIREGVKQQYTHGVWGGINSQAEIEMNFYTESDKLPAFSERTINPDGTLGPELIAQTEEKTLVRDVHSRIVMNYHAAQALRQWLDEKLATIETEETDLTDAFFADTEGGLEQ